ncbi:PAB-dependent poly-A-specific ribonuclease subunit PAN2 [Obba rivulosa]|uniref:PAN2-PAN3 deadenylation complex catalytic subunit PAN2 n=1 Tax=Obba rivulosa TaxID=1052685 RepID=A0A8E2DIA0_9APHY|nr:PAB-dependent poly-A-specific ribonuclease subunit PAN2 [Obba rivulosa]
MSTTYRQLPQITQSAFPQPVTALAFDPVSDTLWTGTSSGSVVAHYGAQGVRGVAFPVGSALGVGKLYATESYVRAVGVQGDGLGQWGKGGANKWFMKNNMTITTFSNNLHNSSFAASTTSPELLIINAVTGNVTQRERVLSLLTHLHYDTTHGVLLTGSGDGELSYSDHRSRLRQQVKPVKAHTSGIQGLQASGNYVYTIGLSTRQGRPFPDPLVKVYDIRTLQPLPPLPFQSGPAFINIIPKGSSKLVITSNTGLVNIVDTTNPTSNEFYHLDITSYIHSTAVSPTGTYLAFGDSEGAVHLMTAGDEGATLPLNGFEGQAVEWADSPEPLPEIEWTDSTPLNTIGMPYYDELLLSSWTPDFLTTPLHFPPPAKIPQQILDTMRVNDNIAYAALPKELRGRRNVVVSAPRKSEGRFRSGRTRRGSEPETPAEEYDADSVPKAYRKVEIEYSKFGVEDFDFGFYNKTEHSGLETHILNSYTNPILQLMHYTLPIRRLAKSHIITDCQREHCLLCELGFVTRMLEDARGTNCQSSNFCKTVTVLAQMGNAIELIDYGRENADLNYAHMIQAFHRFLIEHLISEGDMSPNNPRIFTSKSSSGTNSGEPRPAPSPITQLLGFKARNSVTCALCKTTKTKKSMMHIVDMVYPHPTSTKDNNPGIGACGFSGVLRRSLSRTSQHKGICPDCGKYSVIQTRRQVATRDLPPILAVNAAVYNEDSLNHWKDKPRGERFVRENILVTGDLIHDEDVEPVEYELRSMVIQIVTKDKHSHLVAIVKVPEAQMSQNSELQSPWFIFNDFVVRNISEQEALSFPGNWKVPAVLYFERRKPQAQLDFTGLPDNIDESILCRDTNIALNRDPGLIKHELLSQDELPKPGTLVAIDAEFVQMQQEETEYRSDGTKKVIRPARLSLARVSVLRGDGPKEGVPFIDDHIHTSEVIVDYLTEFSGIKFGDLDPHMSRYTLTPLKVVYKKLRLLVDRGCIFIGHGLSKDFRIINIFVPPEQVIDTVDLYFLKNRQRRLSLRFLAWFVLKQNIQTDTHDSIEDALSALRLYKAYHEFEAEGIFDQKLEELYREGRQYGYKPPPPPGSTDVRSLSDSPVPTPPQPAAPAPFPMGGGNFAFIPPHFMPNVLAPPNFFAPMASPNPFMPPPNWRQRQ